MRQELHGEPRPAAARQEQQGEAEKEQSGDLGFHRLFILADGLAVAADLDEELDGVVKAHGKA